MKKLSKTTWINIAIFATTAIVIAIFMPRPDKVNLNYELGRPWSNAQLLAPFDIPVYRDAETKRALIDSIEENFAPVYGIDNSPLDKINDILSKSGNLTETERAMTMTAIKRIYENGVVDPETAEKIASGKVKELKVHDEGKVSRSYPASRVRSSRGAYLLLDSALRNPSLMGTLRQLGIAGYMTPNFVVNEEESDALRNALLQPVEAGIGVIQKGERIIDRGDIVTPQLYTILQTYETELQKRSDNSTATAINISIGQTIFSFAVMAVLYTFLFLYRPSILASRQRVICLLSVLAAFFIFAVLMSSNFGSGLYIVPFAIVPLLVVVFYDTSVALVALLLEILMCAAFAPYPFEFVFIEMVAGLTAIFSTKELSKRSQLLKTSAYVFVAYVVAYGAVELMQVATLNSFSWKLIGYFAVNMVLTSFAYVLIFVVEKLFGFTSVVTLVELSDINNDVLRELSVECPGTFQHSMAVSNLVAGAAHRVGANVQLVRAGALYHDIGKIKNPAFFTENQHGINPHDALSPMQSARVIISHVTEGIKRAEKAKLPKVIRDMIVQHHGKSTARYFYTTYCNAHPDENVDPEPFTYPGPNPQTKEASLLMMADVVEAASRSLTDHSAEAITALVNRLIDAQVAEGLHKDSPLSFRDITEIKQAFIESLRTMYHVRIAYPKANNTSEKS